MASSGAADLGWVQAKLWPATVRCPEQIQSGRAGRTPASISAARVNGLMAEPGYESAFPATWEFHAAATCPSATLATRAVPDRPDIAPSTAACHEAPRVGEATRMASARTLCKLYCALSRSRTVAPGARHLSLLQILNRLLKTAHAFDQSVDLRAAGPCRWTCLPGSFCYQVDWLFRFFVILNVFLAVL
jgi:hypothetical protein